MYQSINDKSGVSAVNDWIGGVKVESTKDGLELSPPGSSIATKVIVPDRLVDWLVDLRLLRHLPLAYLAPDAGLLPAESIRFFGVDLTWIDRVLDGVFSAG